MKLNLKKVYQNIKWWIEDYQYSLLQNRRERFLIEWVDKQFQIAGHFLTYEDALTIPEWYTKYTITEKQETQLRNWSIKKLKELYPDFTDRWIEQQYSLLVLSYGLKTE